jgi:hypothetical protein
MSKTGPDRPCVLPNDPAWAKDAGYLAEEVLSMLASAADAAEAQGEYRLLLPAVTYHQAAHLLARLAAALPDTPPPPTAGCTCSPRPRRSFRRCGRY